jgi:hypothetical protein
MTGRMPAQCKASQLSGIRQRKPNPPPQRRTPGDRDGTPIRSLHSRDHAHQFVRQNRRIGGGHGIAARYQMIRLDSHRAMNKKPARPCKQHNLSDTNLLEAAYFNS